MKKNIEFGDIAPPFRTTDLWGSQVNIPTQGKWIYLSFHRFAACPFCNLRTNELLNTYESFKKNNIEIVSIWPSSKDSLLRYAGKDKTPFHMVSDENKKIYTAYGVTKSSFFSTIKLLFYPQLIVNALKHTHKKIEVDADPKLMPASFLIDPDGVIKLAYYGAHIGDHPSIKTIFQLTI